MDLMMLLTIAFYVGREDQSPCILVMSIKDKV